MLIFTRRGPTNGNKNGESFRIGDDITVYIMGVSGNQVRVGIDAPKDVQILRTELLEKS